MKEKTARTRNPRLGLELPDALLQDIRDHPNLKPVTLKPVKRISQEPLNAPFLNGLFSRGFSGGKTAH